MSSAAKSCDAARAVNEKDDFREHLLREAEQIRRVGAGRLEPDLVTPGADCLRQCLWRR